MPQPGGEQGASAAGGATRVIGRPSPRRRVARPRCRPRRAPRRATRRRRDDVAGGESGGQEAELSSGAKRGRQLAPALGAPPPVDDRAGGRARVGIGDPRRTSSGRPRPRPMKETAGGTSSKRSGTVASWPGASLPASSRSQTRSVYSPGAGHEEAAQRGAAQLGRMPGGRLAPGGVGDPEGRAGDRRRRAPARGWPRRASKRLSARQPSPPATARPRGAAGAVLSIRIVRSAAAAETDRRSPARTGAASAARRRGPRWRRCGCRRREVGAGPHPRAPPLAADQRLRAGVLGQGDAGAVDQRLPEADPGAGVGGQERRAAGRRASSPPASRPPPTAALGAPVSSRVRVSARTADDRRRRSRPQCRSSARAQSSRLSKAGAARRSRPRRRPGDVSVKAAVATTSKPPPASPVPSRCSMPSCRACHHVPRTAVIPVPAGAVQRQRAKRVAATRWPSRRA